MGGALKSIGGAIGGVIKQVAPSILKAVAPAATGLLKKLTDGFVSTGANFLKTALSALPLPSPLKALAEKLLGKGADMLKQFAGGGIDKLIQGLGDLVMKRLAPGAGQVALPGMNTQARQDGIANNNPATGSASAAATGGTSNAGGISNPSGPSGSSGAPDTMPEFTGNPESYKDQQAHNKKMFAYQQAMSMMQQFWTQMSNIQKSNDDVKKGIAQNYR